MSRREDFIEALTYCRRGACQGGVLHVPQRELLHFGESRDYHDFEQVPAWIAYGPSRDDREPLQVTWGQVNAWLNEGLIERCGAGAHTTHYAPTLKTWRRAPSNAIEVPR